MRTYRARVLGLVGGGVAVLAVALAASVQSARAADGYVGFASAEHAYRTGVKAYRRRSWNRAMDALTFASKNGIRLADFYRARIFADSEAPFYSRARAYDLYKNLTKSLINIDPDVDPRVRFAGQSMTAFARYVRDGLPEVDLPADSRRAVEYLNHAATFFKDADAEFELARMRLTGEAVEARQRLALHSLSRLAQSGHAGALATLAELYWQGSKAFWRGRPQVRRDPVMAYTLAKLAAEYAPYSERLWIEDTYQKIYCGATSGVRLRGGARVAGWRKRYGRPVVQSVAPERIGELIPRPMRTCGDGEPVIFGPKKKAIVATTRRPPQTMPAKSGPVIMHGDPAAFPALGDGREK